MAPPSPSGPRARLRHANASIGGERMFSLSVGEGRDGVPAVVCVHGLGVSSRYFVPMMRLLAPHTRVLAPDLPGFGRSSNPRAVYDVPQLAAALGEWIDRQDLATAPVLVANSMGCQVVADLVDGRPERAAALVLIGPTIDAEHRSAGSQILRLLRAAPFERGSLIPLTAYEYLRCGPRRLLGSLRHALRDPLDDHLPQIPVPTLVVRGAHDVIAPAEWTGQVARLLPRGRQLTIERTGHAVNYSAPDLLLPHVLPFLQPQ